MIEGKDLAQLRLDDQVELRHLRYFLAVADSGSMAEGARRLSLAQSPLSQQIRQLEQRIGVTLFERGRGRAAQLTAAGQVLYARAQQIMETLDEAAEEAREVASGSSGRLRVGAVPTLAPHLTRPLRAFGARYPNALVTFRESGAERLVGLLCAGEIDLALVRLPIPPADVDVKTLWEEEFQLAVPPGHPLEGRPSVALGEVADERFLAWDRKKAWYLYQLVERAFDKEGVRPRMVLEGASFITVARLVGAGYGVSILPPSAVEPIGQPRPSMVPIEGTPVVTPIAGLSRPGSTPSELLAGWLENLERWGPGGATAAGRPQSGMSPSAESSSRASSSVVSGSGTTASEPTNSSAASSAPSR